MNHHISDMLDGLENAGQPITPHSGSAERVKALTLSRLKQEEAALRRRRFRPLQIAAAALAAVLLLGGSVFAAWKLGAFRFTDEFGKAGETLDAYAQSYPQDAADAIPADFGYASWVKAEAGDYNLVLLELNAGDGQLRATLDVSPKDESVPPYRESGLTLAFADYETVTESSEKGAWRDRVELSAALDEPLAADAEITLSLSRSGEAPALASFPLNALDERREALESTDRRHYAVAAETKDYRFSLRTLSVSPSIIYAVLDAEALTDYGKAHSEQYGHERFGPDFTGIPLIPDWDNGKKLVLLGHSFGGATIRLFSEILADGDQAEREVAAPGDLSPFFLGGQEGRLHALVTLAAPTNGTTAYDLHRDESFDASTVKVSRWDNLWGNFFSNRKQAERDGRSEDDYAAFDMHIDNALAMNARISTLPGAYYFLPFPAVQLRPWMASSVRSAPEWRHYSDVVRHRWVRTPA